MKKYLPYFAGITFACIFGFSFMFTKEGLEVIRPFQLLAYRFTFAAISLSLLVLIGVIKIDYNYKRIKLLIILAIIQPGLYFIFETLGINNTTSSEAGMMIALIPVIVTILASIFLKEIPNKKQMFFILLSVAGVVFIVMMRDTGNNSGNITGILFLLGAVLMAGIYNILSRMLSLDFKPVEITFLMMWSGAILFNILAFYKHQGDISSYFSPLIDSQVLISVLYLGLLSSVFAFLLMNYTLAKIEAAQSAVFANLTTIVSILAGVLIRGEPFVWFQIIGGIMIIIGVWGTNYYGRIKKNTKKITV